jgi:hypothetical protein
MKTLSGENKSFAPGAEDKTKTIKLRPRRAYGECRPGDEVVLAAAEADRLIKNGYAVEVK